VTRAQILLHGRTADDIGVVKCDYYSPVCERGGAAIAVGPAVVCSNGQAVLGKLNDATKHDTGAFGGL
jgi:hypothetical protein